MSSAFIGQVMIFGGNFAPAGFAICDGSLLSVAENTELYQLIGTTYGGDGVNTFALPDLRGRVPIGQGQGPFTSPHPIGQIVGVESVMLAISQIPPHSHRLNAVDGPGTTNIPADNTVLSGLGGQASSGEFQTPAYAAKGNQVALNARSVGASGGSQPHQNRQPYLAINFCIAVSGPLPLA